MFTILETITITICLIIGLYKGVIKEEYAKGAFWLCLAIFNQLTIILDKIIIIK